MHSEGINAGEMKHGPLALVDDKLPIVVMSTMDTMHSKMAGVIQQVGHEKLVFVSLLLHEFTGSLVCAFSNGGGGEQGTPARLALV